MACNNCVLLNKDVPVLNFTFVENPNVHTPLINKINEVYNLNFAPLPIVARHKGSRTGLFDLNYWWINRCIPFYRRSRHIRILRENLSYAQYCMLFRQSMGRGLTDHYWIKEENDSRTYAEVNFFDNAFPEDLGNLFLAEGSVLAADKMFTPDLTLAGHSFKTWKINEKGERILCRLHYWNGEIYNEMAAAAVLKIFDIDHVDYWPGTACGRQVSSCKNFLTKDIEYVTLSSLSSGIKYFGAGYLPELIGEKFYGDFLKDAMKIALIGYVVNNWDLEYGFLRNANTMKIIGIAPVFDFSAAFWNDHCFEHLAGNKLSDTFMRVLPSFVQQAGLDVQLLEEIVPTVQKIFSACPFFDSGELEQVIKYMKMRIADLQHSVGQTSDSNICNELSFEQLANFVESVWFGSHVKYFA